MVQQPSGHPEPAASCRRRIELMIVANAYTRIALCILASGLARTRQAARIRRMPLAAFLRQANMS